MEIEDAARERCLDVPPPDSPMYAENFMLAAYDPAVDVGAWLHLGTWPEDFTLWEDLVLLSLPDGDALTMTGYRRTPVADRPAGSLLSFRCVEPFRRWVVEFDGLATRSERARLAESLVRDGPRERVRLRFEVTCVTPVWDGARSSSGTRGRGSMADQVWASDHYQQLLRVEGEVLVGGQPYAINATGVRDHSRGQRGHAMDQWGGHALVHLLFPSGRAIGVQRMFAPGGEPVFDMAYTLVDGVLRDADVLDTPRLSGPADGGESLALVVRTDDRTHDLRGSMVTSWRLTPHRLGMGVGTDTTGPYGVFAPGHARWEWDGETTFGLTERSYGARPPAAGTG
jgi:hypothetical protein